MIFFAFLLATTLFILQTIPSLYLPFQAYIQWITFYVLKSFGRKALFTIAIVGAALDLLSDHPFGVYPISYIATAFFLSHYRFRFSALDPLHLALGSSIASFFSSMCQLFLLFLLSDKKVSWGGSIVLVDLFGRALFDGLCAFLWFFLPLTLFIKCLEKIRVRNLIG